MIDSLLTNIHGDIKSSVIYIKDVVEQNAPAIWEMTKQSTIAGYYHQFLGGIVLSFLIGGVFALMGLLICTVCFEETGCLKTDRVNEKTIVKITCVLFVIGTIFAIIGFYINLQINLMQVDYDTAIKIIDTIKK